MNLRNEWKPNLNTNDYFYTSQESINNVKENFDLRRRYSSEGKQLTINNVTEWCIVQTSSNPLNELDDLRKIYCPISMVINSGDYVMYENDTWLIDTNVVNVDGAYLYTRMHRCNYLLKFQDENAKIIETWIVSQNAAQYNNGESGNKTIVLGSDQLMLFIPYNADTIKLRRGKRFFIDNNKSNPMAYKLTRPDTTSFVKNGQGYISLIVTEDVIVGANDRPDLMLCDYIEPTTPPTPSGWVMEINCKSNYLYVGGSYKVITAILKDAMGIEVPNTEYVWTVTSNIPTLLNTVTNGKEFQIKVINDVNAIGESIKVSVASKYTGQVAECTLIVQG